MLLFVPGRHHLLTQFQYDYLLGLTQFGLSSAGCVRGLSDGFGGRDAVQGIVFAVTSSNHFGTRRNPIPFYLRALAIHEFGKTLPVPVHVYGVNDVGTIDNFAAFTLKTIDHETFGRFDLSPANTIVVCSTPVAEGYLSLGYRVATAEQGSNPEYVYENPLPWYWAERVGEGNAELDSDEIVTAVHESSLRVWCDYALDRYVRDIFSDPLCGDDGDLTASRDYSSYVRSMDEIAELKFKDTAAYLRAGRIGDIGCAVGSWIKLASSYSLLAESDFYGIEVARPLYDVCVQRKLNNEFKNPSVFFHRKNAVTGFCFKPQSMDTIHTGSITHEIESYGSRAELLQFIENRYAELKPGGVWINRDVVGPEDGDRDVLMLLNDDDGILRSDVTGNDSESLSQTLGRLSTYEKFLRFSGDFRREEHDTISFELCDWQGRKAIKLAYRDAAEFLLTKDYTDNWESEMHERFCFWSYRDWTAALERVGFRIHPDSRAYRNPWIVENRFMKCAELIDPKTFLTVEYPPTNLVIIGEKT